MDTKHNMVGAVCFLLVIVLVSVIWSCNGTLAPFGPGNPFPTIVPTGTQPTGTNQITQNFNLSSAFTGINTVRVVNPNGSITMRIDPAATNVAVTGDKSTPGTIANTTTTNQLNQITINAQPVTANSSTLQIEAIIPVGSGAMTDTVDFVITVPAGVDMDLNTQNGDITVDGNTGVVLARTTNGVITITNNIGNVNASTSNAALALGNITGNVIGTTNNAPINVTARIPAGGTINLNNNNGEITLQVPTATAATMTLTTNNGTVSTNLSGFFVTNRQQPAANAFSATLNGGGGQIFASTANANITFAGNNSIP
jgi:hypothetical protein